MCWAAEYGSLISPIPGVEGRVGVELRFIFEL